MAVSGISAFSMTAAEILDAAFARIRGEETTAYEVKSATRSMNLTFQDFSNRGVNLWTLEEVTLSISTASVASYTLDADTLDVIWAITRDTQNNQQTDIICQRIGLQQYFELTDKTDTGRPYQYAIQRGREYPILFLYPLSDGVSATSFIYYRIRRLDDIVTLRNNPDVPRNFLPAVVSGIAYYMALERPQITPDRIGFLKQVYEEDFARAATEDRDRAPLRLEPDLSMYFSR